MDFTLDSFVAELRQQMYVRFPYENDYLNRKKHPNTPQHIRDVAFMDLPITVNINLRSFDIGSYMAEAKYPYYHILQDAPVIRKRNRATAKSRGSQAAIENLGQRDYGRVKFNGKTYTKEYAKNVRGERASIIERARDNPRANSYVNIHYQYIDKMLDQIMPLIALEFGGKLKRKQSSGLLEEFELQEQEDLDERYDMDNIIDSFME